MTQNDLIEVGLELDTNPCISINVPVVGNISFLAGLRQDRSEKSVFKGNPDKFGLKKLLSKCFFCFNPADSICMV